MKKKRIRYVWVDGRKERLYTKAEMKREIDKNQDVVFHKDGWKISDSAGH